MPKIQPPTLLKRCRRCGELKPLRRFERRLTAAQAIFNHERRRAAGTLGEDPDVLEFTDEDRAWAAEQNPPLTLTRYKVIRGAVVASRTCLDCRPQAPFEGDVSTPDGRLNAIHSGALAPTVERSTVLVDAKRAAMRADTLDKARSTRAFVVTRKRLLTRLRKLVALELRSARNKIYYFERSAAARAANSKKRFFGDGRKISEARRAVEAKPAQDAALEKALRRYLTLVQAVHQLIVETPHLPAVAWQLAMQYQEDRIDAKDIVPLVAMTFGTDEYDAVVGPLRRACYAYDDFIALAPKAPPKLPWLALADVQDNGIALLHDCMERFVKEARSEHDWAAALEDDPTLAKGIPKLGKLLAREQKRIAALRGLEMPEPWHAASSDEPTTTKN